MSGLTALGLRRLARPTSAVGPAATAYLPIVLILYGALVPPIRLLVLGLLLLGFAVALLRRSELRWAWAAPIPIAVWIAWRTMSAPLAHPGGLDCADAASPPAIWRLAQALLALGTLAVLMGILAVRPGAIWWRRPPVPIARLAVLGFFVAAPLGLLLGGALARPYFRTFELDLGDPMALVPGLVFSLSNAISEEVIYRGAFMSFAGRVFGLRTALVLQAVVFGSAHAGVQFLGSPLPVVLGIGAGGYVAGLLVLKTRSLMLPIAVHTALDLPIYAYFACRNPLPL